jgi:4-hydroxy-4-methyl-2-oxoglutarate aldolase
MGNSELIAEFNKLSITHICDAYDKVRLLNPSIRPILTPVKMMGKAFTVFTDGDLLPIIKAIDVADPGSVIIVNSNNAKRALAGEIFSAASKKRGLAGIVIDGYCRDVGAIQKINFPFYAKGVCPKAGTKEKTGKLNTEIRCGDVMISPNDIIFGDENGIIALTESELMNTFPLALEISMKEEKALKKIDDGTKLADLFNFDEHYNNVLNGKESQFSWTL